MDIHRVFTLFWLTFLLFFMFQCPFLRSDIATDVSGFECVMVKQQIVSPDTETCLVSCLCLQPYEKVSKVMERPFYMNPRKAVEFGVADKVSFPFPWRSF